MKGGMGVRRLYRTHVVSRGVDMVADIASSAPYSGIRGCLALK